MRSPNVCNLMRREGVWLKMLALIVLTLAYLPVSAIASLCFGHSQCTMPCCVELAAEPAASEKSCGACPGESKAAKIQREEVDACGCMISATTSVPMSDAVALCAPLTPSVPVAVQPAPLLVIAASEVPLAMPGIRGFDSGPPPSRPYCVWSGRAPPVRLA